MKFLSLAWRNVLRNKRRTLIAAGTIAVGTMALLCAAGYVQASFLGLREFTIKGGLGHLQIGLPEQFGGYQETPLEHALPEKEAAKVTEAVNQQAGVKFAMARVLFEGLISNGERTVIFIGQGVEPGKERKLSRNFAPVVSGRNLPSLKKAKADDPHKVILGKELAKDLQAKPGDMLTLLATTVDGVLNAVDVSVSGHYTTGVPERDKRSLKVPLPTARLLLGSAKLSRMVVVLEQTEGVTATQAALQSAFPQLAVMDWFALAPFYQKVRTLYRSIFVVMGVIIVLVVLLSSTNAMLMSIFERAAEIGTMRAFGMSRRRLTSNFFLEGALIGAMGAVAGSFGSFVLAQVVNQAGIMMPPPPGLNLPIPLLLEIEGHFYGAVVLLLILVGAISAWYPGRRATRQSIVEALTHV